MRTTEHTGTQRTPETTTSGVLHYSEGMRMMNDLLTLREAADLLGVHRTRIYQWVTQGRLTVEHHGERATLVRREDVLTLERRPTGRPRKTA